MYRIGAMYRGRVVMLLMMMIGPVIPGYAAADDWAYERRLHIRHPHGPSVTMQY